MLQVFGHLYSDNQEHFNEVAEVLKNAGYQIAFEYPTNATIIKEVENEPTNQDA